MQARASTPWAAFGERAAGARLRLICLPFAGGGIGPYRDWADALGPGIDVVPVTLPGREHRITEPAIAHLPDMLDALAAGLRPVLDRPYALFGWSMGALIAFHLAHRLRAAGPGEPAHLFVGARAAPRHGRDRAPIHDLPSPAFWEAVAGYGGTPQGVLDEPELRELFEPTLRADFHLSETAEPAVADRLACPVTALGGQTDDDPPPAHLDAWAEVTDGPFARALLPGGHFVITGRNAEIRRRVAGDLGVPAAGAS